MEKDFFLILISVISEYLPINNWLITAKSKVLIVSGQYLTLCPSGLFCIWGSCTDSANQISACQMKKVLSSFVCSMHQCIMLSASRLWAARLSLLIYKSNHKFISCAICEWLRIMCALRYSRSVCLLHTNFQFILSSVQSCWLFFWH